MSLLRRKSPKRRSRRKSPKRKSRRKSPKRKSRRKSPKRKSRRKSPKRSNKDSIIILSNSSRKEKKFMVKINNKTVHFGAKGYSDYTKHKDINRKQRYINRHKKRENWNKSGINTAGFWSRWLLWGEPTIQKSIKKIENKFNVNISHKK